jgi:hypothetical protein
MMLSYASFLSFVLSEKGGEDFLTAAYDYIDAAEKKAKKTKRTKRTKKAKKIGDGQEVLALKVIKLKRGEIFDKFKKIKSARRKQIV